MLKIAICDDEKIDRKMIHTLTTQYISEYHMDADIHEFEAADGLLGALNDSSGADQPDIIFLDIFMSGMNGIELAKKLRNEGNRSEIVFITSSNEFAADAYEVDAVSYLRKPLEASRFNEVMDRMMNRFSQTRAIEVNCERTLVRIYVSDITYLETRGRQLIIHTVAQRFEVYQSMAGVLKLLPHDEFVQTSRFETISLAHVTSIDEKEARMDDGTVVQLSQRLVEHIIERYDEYRRRIR
jgi:DNA-binding LytR/AlgR family response regulator